MEAYAKFKFFHDNMLGSIGSTLTATSTEASGSYDVDYIHNWLEINMWKAEDSGLADPQYLTYDAGSGNTASADYFGAIIHNLNTVGATVTLSNSTDNFAADEDIIIALRPTADTVLHAEASVIANGGQEVWSNGTSTVPDGWTISGAGASIVRDAVNFYSGLYGAAITRSGNNVFYRTAVVNYTYYQGRTITIGAWIKASTATQVRLAVQDGIGGTSGSFHTGGGDWEFLTATRTIDGSATTLQFDLQIIVDGTVYMDGAVMIEASAAASTDISDFIQPSSNAKRYWRLKIAGHGSTAPYLGIVAWGDKTEMDFATATFDPYEENVKANVNVSQGGFLTGIHPRYSERKLRIKFDDSDSILYNKVKTWWDNHKLKNFFVAWETRNNPTDVYLMRSDPRFRNPFNQTGLFRDITVSLTGRKE